MSTPHPKVMPVRRFLQQLLRRKHEIWVDTAAKTGSVEHYYHYILGYLIPICCEITKWEGDPKVSRILARDCGPMNRITEELNLKKLAFSSREPREDRSFTSPPRILRLEGFDEGDLFLSAASRDCIKLGVQIITEKIQQSKHYDHECQLAHDLLKEKNVLIIGRSNPSDFYLKQAEVKGSGSDRRSIANFSDLVSTIERNGFLPAVEFLENRSLAYQIALFANADIIIAQHGAALVNLLWCKPGTKVLEIVPEQIKGRRMFEKLSKGFGYRHKRIVQSGLHSEVDPARIVEELRGFED